MKPTKKMFMDDPEQDKVETKNPKASKKAKAAHEPVVDIPSDGHLILDLPSRGQFGYPSSVEYRDIMAKDEETLTSSTVTSYVRTLNGVIKGILGDCSFFEQMTTHDRDYALIWLWANNYNPKKTADIECEHCGTKNQNVVVDLTDLDVTNPDPEFTGAFKMVLKATGKPVTVRLNTVADEIEVEKYISKNESEAAKNEYLMRVCSIDVGMKIPLESKVKWVGENVNAREMAKVREFHRRFRYGVKTRLDHTCSGCGEVTQFDLPFSAKDILLPYEDMGDMDFDFV